jgi:L-iditol 2-dehydrogenase
MKGQGEVMASMMPAVRKMKAGPGNVDFCETPVPEIGPNDVLMKVYAAGICGSDLLIQEDRHFYRAPVTQGHEFSGIAYKVGKNITRVKEGDKFIADIECSKGEWLGVTVDGAFAPYMRVPENVIYRVPDHVPIEHAAMGELIAATHHLIQERAQVRVGDDVVIVGPGPMGIVATQYAKICGARRVILIGLKSDEMRLAIGRQVGADVTLYSEDDPAPAVMEITGGKGAEFVLECSASELGVQHAIDCARKAYEGPGGKGVVVFISLWGRQLRVNLDQVSLGQLDIRGSWSWNGRETWEHAVDLLDRGLFDFAPMITGHYALEDWETAFTNLREKRDLKAMFLPNGSGWAK